MVTAIWYAATRGLQYWLLTMPRTVGGGVLWLFALIGGLGALLRWSAAVWLGRGGTQYLDVFLLSVLTLLVLLAPVFVLFCCSPAGKQTTLFDGLALGAFTGVGFVLVQSMGWSFEEIRLLLWPPGALLNPRVQTLLPGEETLTLWAGPAAWGAVLGGTVAAARRLRNRLGRWVWLALALVALLVFLELFTYVVAIDRYSFAQESIWYRLAKAFCRIDGSGRGTGVILMGLFVGAFVAEEVLLHRTLPAFPAFRLKVEPDSWGMISELEALWAARRAGWTAFREAARFFAIRRRLAVVASEERSGPGAEDDAAASGVAAIAEQAARQLYRAETALTGQPLDVIDREPAGARLWGFLKGLVGTIATTVLYMLFIGWLGIYLTGALNNNPIGYVYASITATSLAYAVAYYRAPLSRGLAALWQRSGARMLLAARNRLLHRREPA